MRLIDADALKGPLELQQASYARIGATERAKAYADCLWEIEQAPTIGGWISVKDRLPGNETEVIIIVQHKIGWYRAFAWRDEYGWHSSAEEFGDGESDFVTYWTPLPEPPKEVTGE